MSQRVARKKRHVLKTDIDREFNSKLGVLKRAREDTVHKARLEYEAEIKEIRTKFESVKIAAEREYSEGRDALLKSMKTD